MAAARLSKRLIDLVLDLIFMSVGDIHAFKAGHDALTGHDLRLVDARQRFPCMPVEDLNGVFPKQGEHDVLSMGMQHIAPALRSGKDRDIIGHAVLFVEILLHQIIGGELRRKENAIGAQLDDALDEGAGGLCDGSQGCLHLLSMTGSDVLHHVRTQFVRRSQRTEDSENDRHFAIGLLQQSLQVVLLTSQRPLME